MSDGESAGGQSKLRRLEEHRRTLEALSRIGPEGPPERLMQHVTAQVGRVTNIERVKVMRYRPERGDLLVEAGVGWKPGVVGSATLAVDHRSPAGRAFQTGAPVAIRDIRDNNEFRYPDLLREHGITSLVNAPIMINGATWGILEVDDTEPLKFDEWDISFLSAVANILGICLALHAERQKTVEAAAETARQRAQSAMAIRELQHRTKNNLQIISSFLSLKLRELSPDVRERLDAVIGRIQAIALAHDLLSIAAETSSLSFDDYLRSLCANLDPPRPDITIEVVADHVTVPIDRAVPAGLVVNELVTNSLKYAFGNGGGHIRVHFAAIGNFSEGCLAVEDDGKGLPADHPKGFGLTLVEGLANQIQGRVEYPKVESGTKVVLYFPLPAK